MARLLFLTFFGELPRRATRPSTTSTSRPGRCSARSSCWRSARSWPAARCPRAHEARSPAPRGRRAGLPAGRGARSPTRPGCPWWPRSPRVVGILVAWYLYLAMPDLRAALAAAAAAGAARVRREVLASTTSTTASSAAWSWTGSDALPLEAGRRGADRRRGQPARAPSPGPCAEALRPVQTGFVRHYALLILAGAVALVSLPAVVMSLAEQPPPEPAHLPARGGGRRRRPDPARVGVAAEAPRPRRLRRRPSPLSLLLRHAASRTWPAMQFAEQRPWIPAWGISYHVGHRRAVAVARDPHHLPDPALPARLLDARSRSGCASSWSSCCCSRRG